MKKIFFTWVFMLLAAVVLAQQPQHLLFKGVPIDGTMDAYILQMKQAGFTLIKTEDGAALLIGDFAGHKNCSLFVTTLKQKNLVYKITVHFSDKETWLPLFGNYAEIKQLLTEKYGNPTEVIEKFDRRTEALDDMIRMMDVRSDRCKYSSNWNTDKGTIVLSIDHIGYNTFVKLEYFDKINGAVIKLKAKDDL